MLKSVRKGPKTSYERVRKVQYLSEHISIHKASLQFTFVAAYDRINLLENHIKKVFL